MMSITSREIIQNRRNAYRKQGRKHVQGNDGASESLNHESHRKIPQHENSANFQTTAENNFVSTYWSENMEKNKKIERKCSSKNDSFAKASDASVIPSTREEESINEGTFQSQADFLDAEVLNRENKKDGEKAEKTEERPDAGKGKDGDETKQAELEKETDMHRPESEETREVSNDDRVIDDGRVKLAGKNRDQKKSEQHRNRKIEKEETINVRRYEIEFDADKREKMDEATQNEECRESNSETLKKNEATVSYKPAGPTGGCVTIKNGSGNPVSEKTPIPGNKGISKNGISPIVLAKQNQNKGSRKQRNNKVEMVYEKSLETFRKLDVLVSNYCTEEMEVNETFENDIDKDVVLFVRTHYRKNDLGKGNPDSKLQSSVLEEESPQDKEHGEDKQDGMVDEEIKENKKQPQEILVESPETEDVVKVENAEAAQRVAERFLELINANEGSKARDEEGSSRSKESTSDETRKESESERQAKICTVKPQYQYRKSHSAPMGLSKGRKAMQARQPEDLWKGTEQE